MDDDMFERIQDDIRRGRADSFTQCHPLDIDEAEWIVDTISSLRAQLAERDVRIAELEIQRDDVDQQLANMRAAQLQTSDSPDQRCGFCGLAKTPEGHDGCLGTLPGVMNACCGHGRPHEAYIQFEDGSRIADVHGLIAALATLRAEQAVADGE